jgi:hypothetical protein
MINGSGQGATKRFLVSGDYLAYNYSKSSRVANDMVALTLKKVDIRSSSSTV